MRKVAALIGAVKTSPTDRSGSHVLRLPPFAPHIARSLRGIGYTTATALADILDNSLAAGATIVDVRFEWRDAPRISVLDDGCGMTREQLIESMRLGSDSLAVRSEGDLGRFGLGLKTASLSQAAALTVISKADGQAPWAVRWDIDRIASAGDWELEEGSPEALGMSSEEFDAKLSGTLVVWDRLDQLTGDPSTVDGFFAVAEAVGQHLGMTFHRMISAKRMIVLINGKPVTPWDPFQVEMVEYVESGEVGGNCGPTVRGCVLPPPSSLARDEERRVAGPADWLEQQGFYVYRKDRLIVGGGWMGLGPEGRPWRLDRKYNLARLSIDILGAHDAEWALDVRKSLAHPPEFLRVELTTIAGRVRRRAVGRSREGALQAAVAVTATNANDTPPIWIQRSDGAAIQFRVNRRHPLVSELRKILDEPAPLRALLDILEKSVPVPPASARTGLGLAAIAAKELEEADIKRLVLTIYPTYRRGLGLTEELALDKLLSQPHLSNHEQLVIVTVEEIESEMRGVA